MRNKMSFRGDAVTQILRASWSDALRMTVGVFAAAGS
jgi:hypothetical protein